MNVGDLLFRNASCIVSLSECGLGYGMLSTPYPDQRQWHAMRCRDVISDFEEQSGLGD
jgi:hypothetical protein